MEAGEEASPAAPNSGPRIPDITPAVGFWGPCTGAVPVSQLIQSSLQHFPALWASTAISGKWVWGQCLPHVLGWGRWHPVGWGDRQSQPGRPAAVGTGQAEPNGREQDLELREGPRSLPQTPERHPLLAPRKTRPPGLCPSLTGAQLQSHFCPPSNTLHKLGHSERIRRPECSYRQDPNRPGLKQDRSSSCPSRMAALPSGLGEQPLLCCPLPSVLPSPSGATSSPLQPSRAPPQLVLTSAPVPLAKGHPQLHRG